MQIRESNGDDRESLRQVHEDAFGESEGDSVSRLVVDLLDDETALPILSLVAEKDNRILGHILFSAVAIDGSKTPGVFILAPLAVASDCQGSGIGTALIEQGLTLLRKQHASIVLVLGDPEYYSRTGFKPGHGLKSPYQLAYPEAWMAQELVPGALAKTKGTVKCAASLSSPEHW
ncbi:MAG: GNAT family N-acetyltransferase [Gammaproteobacteria bacterium]